MKRLSEIIFLRVVTRGGESLGRVIDFRSQGEAEHGDSRKERKITSLVYADIGLLERLGLRKVKEKIIPWQSVIEIKKGQIVVENAKA